MSSVQQDQSRMDSKYTPSKGDRDKSSTSRESVNKMLDKAIGSHRGIALDGSSADAHNDLYTDSFDAVADAEYVSSIAPARNQDLYDVAPDGASNQKRRLIGQYTAPKDAMLEYVDEEEDVLKGKYQQRQIAARENAYQKQRFAREEDIHGQQNSYSASMEEQELAREEARVRREIQRLQDKKEPIKELEETPRVRRRRFDVRPEDLIHDREDEKNLEVKEDLEKATSPKRSRWEEPTQRSTSEDKAKRSRWDQAPQDAEKKSTETQNLPSISMHDLDPRFGPMSDKDLDKLIPSKGYKIIAPPEGYEPISTGAKKSVDTLDSVVVNGYRIPESDPNMVKHISSDLPTDVPGVGDLAFFKQEDMKYFGKLFDSTPEEKLSLEELKERKIMRLILKVKNGTPPMRKSALRQLRDSARQFGAGPLFNQILPLLMERSLEDQERHLLVKIIDRVLYKLDDLVRPYVHKILVVIEPLLIDEDYYARMEGREIISNLSKAAGLAHMIATMRPDIDHVDEYVRNTTARAFSVVASALGIPALIPFLRAVCRSKKSWQARHTGVKIIQQIAILMGCAILPHLKALVDCIGPNLEDEHQKVRIMTALALAALAESAAPYGIESFDSVLEGLWKGTKRHRGKALAAFLKATGFIIPLMDPEYASAFTKRIMDVLRREFSSPDEDMKKIVLKVISQCAATDGIEAKYLKEEVLPDFFRNFWIRRMALDRRNYRQVVQTTVELSQKVGVSEIVERTVFCLKDENEAYRKMAVETIEKVITSLGAADLDQRLEERLIDGMLFAFQEQTVEDVILLNGFGTVINALGLRCKPYLLEIVSTILWRLNNKSAKVRQQSADLISRIAVVLKQCGEEQLMGKLGVVLYEYLGEEYPEVLGSIVGSLRAIVSVVGMSSMQPPIKDLLPRLTPILRNRHEKVQENTIDLVGRIADRGPEFVSAREWMRICFELLDMLKAHKKGIRRAAVNTFGYIAQAIGPQDILALLLNNLKVQERQNRVCTTVAIAIVAETCAPFTVVPALMADYRTPELNVQNGVLKSLSFMFEYIGEMGRDYVYAVTPLLEDALIDRDQVHRQTAASVVKHMALGSVGLGVEDAMIHLLNLVWPNILEESPHVINAVRDAVDGIRNCVGVGIVMDYLFQGLFHPSRKVRHAYWTVYNNAYVQHADSMVPYYPSVPDDDHNSWLRHDLQIMI